jgi:hypothetical protein
MRQMRPSLRILSICGPKYAPSTLASNASSGCDGCSCFILSPCCSAFFTYQARCSRRTRRETSSHGMLHDLREIVLHLGGLENIGVEHVAGILPPRGEVELEVERS